MQKFHVLTGALTVSVAGGLTLSPDQERRIDVLWKEALQSNPAMFDGPILLVRAIDGENLSACRASYRHVVAMRRDPALRQALGGLRPLAVSGILSCPQGLVFGQRSAEVATAQGLWELVPSGGAESEDLDRQILGELEEEIGLCPPQVRLGPPAGLVTTPVLVDVILPIETELNADAIFESHARLGSPEYTRLRTLAPEAAATIPKGEMVPATRLLLDHLFLSERPRGQVTQSALVRSADGA